MDDGSSYTADRAAALSGVPRSTVYHWARNGPVLPSASPQKTLLWSYTDLLALRLVYWLRHPKDHPAVGAEIPPTKMAMVRDAIARLRNLDLDLFDAEQRPVIAVTPDGQIVIKRPNQSLERPSGQRLFDEMLDLVAEFSTGEGTHGPDLIQPRPLLRILPRKLGGAPHIAESRVPTETLAGLASRGYGLDRLKALYPFLQRDAIRQSLELEEELSRNLAPAA